MEDSQLMPPSLNARFNVLFLFIAFTCYIVIYYSIRFDSGSSIIIAHFAVKYS
ncbi:hypothetical protein BACI349Y_50177 [Bacillus sp. 349Y]|nr:hypothetical protein BACI349Y_50177 [Bacillus sp. 349Y]